MKEYLNTQSIVVRFDSLDITPTPAMVARYLGGSKYNAGKQIRDLIANIIIQGLNLIVPRMVYAIYPTTGISGGNQKSEEKNETLLRMLLDDLYPQDKYIVATVCTLGPELETTCHRYINEKKRLEAIILDATGVAMLEVLSDKVLDFFNKLAEKKQLNTSCRYCPGNSGLPLAHQLILFSLVKGSKIEVYLSKKLVMHPNKSISFFVGFTSDKNAHRGWYKCQLCPEKKCHFRRQD